MYPLLLSALACGGSQRAAPIAIDGSSTVYPITEAVAEEFEAAHPGVRVTIGVSGTGGGFKKFCAGETVISDASRPIRPVELQSCAAAGVEFIELPVAYDGISVVVNPAADWADHVSVEELKTLWEPAAQGRILRWNQVREGWPDEEIHLFGPGVDSGTYDYFTKAVNGQEHASRGDFTSSEDDNVLVQGIATDRLALGYFGFAYYAANRERLKVLPVGTEHPVAPSTQTISDGSYQPLSRPVFIYVSKAAAGRQELRDLVSFYLEHAPQLVTEVGYVPLPDRGYALARKRFEQGRTGSAFGGKGATVGVSVEDLLSRE